MKFRRSNEVHKQKAKESKEKLKRRLAQKKLELADPSLKEKRLEENVPKTLERLREKDDTIVNGDEEVMQEIETDEFAAFFNGQEPKVMITTSKNASKVTNNDLEIIRLL
jgi:ribosome production factor 1